MATALRNYRLYIGGQWVDATSDDGLDVINPANQATIGTVPNIGQAQANGSGVFSFTDTNAPAFRLRFYRLSLP